MILAVRPGAPVRVRHARAGARSTLAAVAGKAHLLYLDPPFGTGKSFYMADPDAPDGNGPLAYEDERMGLDERRAGARALAAGCLAALSELGTVVLHCDANSAHRFRTAFEDEGGEDVFRGEIVVRSGSRDDAPRPHTWSAITPTHNSLLLFGRHVVPDGGDLLPRYRAEACASSPGAGPSDRPLDTLWCDLEVRGRATAYPTEKSVALAARLVGWLTHPDDLVVEPFAGSGRFACTALGLGRRVVVGDSSALGTLQSGLELAKQVLRGSGGGTLELPTSGERTAAWLGEQGAIQALVVVDDAGTIVDVLEGPRAVPALVDSGHRALAVVGHRAFRIDTGVLR